MLTFSSLLVVIIVSTLAVSLVCWVVKKIASFIFLMIKVIICLVLKILFLPFRLVLTPFFR